jgi:hypothetical protein
MSYGLKVSLFVSELFFTAYNPKDPRAPSAKRRISLISLNGSNAAQEFQVMQVSCLDPSRILHVVVIDGFSICAAIYINFGKYYFPWEFGNPLDHAVVGLTTFK